MEACTLQVTVKLPECINQSEFLELNLNPVVVLTDIRKTLKETKMETPPRNEAREKQKTQSFSGHANRQKKKKDISKVVTPGKANDSLSHPKRFKSMKRKRETWDPSVEYEIEEILGYHRDKKSRMLYLVKWKNWSSDYNTFEPIGNLTGCHYELMRYFETSPPMPQDVLQKDAELYEGLSRRKIYKALLDGSCRAEDLAEFSRECPEAQGLLQTRDLNRLEDRIQEEYMYIVRCLIGMCSHQDYGLVLRGQNYKLLLKLIQLRRKQLENNAAFERLINTREKTEIVIENEVDLEEFPRINYIVELKPMSGVVLPQDPLLGCECPYGCNVKSRCCGPMADSVFAYGVNGRLRTSEKVPIYECNSRCRCPPSCPNRVVQRGRQVRLCIFKTRNCGWGVKALENIPKGTFVCEYVGELISEEEANAREANAKHYSYLFNLDFFTDTSLPMYCIDAAQHGNVARFINHSCDPNLVVYPVWVEGIEPNLHRLAFFARKNIQKNEEILFDYENLGEPVTIQTEDWNPSDRLKCQCDSANCRKWVFRSS